MGSGSCLLCRSLRRGDAVHILTAGLIRRPWHSRRAPSLALDTARRPLWLESCEPGIRVGCVRKEAALPFKSQAQRRKFAELLVAGKISNETFEEWNRETGAKTLPERVKPRASGRARKAAKKR